MLGCGQLVAHTVQGPSGKAILKGFYAALRIAGVSCSMKVVAELRHLSCALGAAAPAFCGQTADGGLVKL